MTANRKSPSEEWLGVKDGLTEAIWPAWRSVICGMECAHKFAPWFGPVLKCVRCGSTTMVTMDKNESKPIYPPAKDRST